MIKNILLFVLLLVTIGLLNCNSDPCGSGHGSVIDEAQCVQRGEETLKGADEDYYRDMDYGESKNPKLIQDRLLPFVPGITKEQALSAYVQGRNNWIVWTAGNDRLWDELSRASVGKLDLLKTLSTHDALGPNNKRKNRWTWFGVVNEPCFKESKGPNPDRHGLHLDVRDPKCKPDPFENEKKYPGVKFGARGKTIPAGSYYGYGTGVVGLRLFPNPYFDEKAKKNWDPKRYYEDPTYYNDKNLVKPYRVGMSCGFCHVGPNPTNPPKDPANPTWANLNSNPGAQYYWVDRIFKWKYEEDSFAYQLFHTAKPGSLDTSLVSTDYINNPRTMNAIYNLGARVVIGEELGKEKLATGSLNNKQINEFVPKDSPLNKSFVAPNIVLTTRVLKDGSDSVGALGALNRVFINIGLFSEEWLTNFMPLVGGKKIIPFEIEIARKNSSYWRANEAQTPNLALFFLASATPDYLKKAPGGSKYLTGDVATGKRVFAESCARCHSSKLPKKTPTHFPDKGCVNKEYLSCWENYWQWTKTDEFKKEMLEIVMSGDFLENNFLSSELRVPATLMETNSCSPLATNAIRDNVWDNFSSESYKNLPSVGKVKIQHPYTGVPSEYELAGGGRGFTRPASLISVWSTAPLLQNNVMGKFYESGSVADRIKSFDDSIEKLLWPEKRLGIGRGDDPKYAFTVETKSGLKHPGLIQRTTTTSYLFVPGGFLPSFLRPTFLSRLLPWLFDAEGVKLGPIPKGTPVSLISNIDLERKGTAAEVIFKAVEDLKKLPENSTTEQQEEVFMNLVKPLLKASKCKDYVVNKGHYFGTKFLKEDGERPLTDAEKKALIAYLKSL